VATTETIPGYVRLEQAAEIIGVHPSQVWRYIDQNLLNAIKIGNTHLVKESDAKKFKRPPRGNPAFRRGK
jgi:excisionase family DNA binding protein